MINKIFEKLFCKPLVIFMITFLIASSLSCNNKSASRQKSKKEKYEDLKEPLINVNKYLVKKDNDIIEKYVKRRGWDMTLTKSGLWYEIYNRGSGDSVKTGNIVTIAYDISLLDGRHCYSSDSLGLKSFKVGQGGVEPGLEEGILLLKKGDKARLILQPFLAHGLLGDDNLIPPRSTIVYDIELLNVK